MHLSSLLALSVLSAVVAQSTPESTKLRAIVAATPTLPLQSSVLELDPPLELGMVSSVAVDAEGLIYILQRGEAADPVIVANAEGKVLRSWGRGMYEIPHNIRIDPEGHVWTADAKSSRVLEFDRNGKELLEIQVELPENPREGFRGTTDIAFAPNGDIYISDGYQNTRVLRYSREGELKGEWGSPGTGPGELNLPHGIAIDPGGTVYVADRENLRIQRFDLEGRYLGMWELNGKAFSVDWAGPGALWTGTQPHDVPNGAEGWLFKLDPSSGEVLGLVEAFGHSVEATPDGQVLTGLRPGSTLVFRPE